MKMQHRFICFAALLLISLVGCGPKPVDFDLQLTAVVDGLALPEVEVLIDGVMSGKTDVNGSFTKTLSRLPAVPVRVELKKDRGTVHTLPWETTFSVSPKQSGSDSREVQSFTANLQRYVVVIVSHEGAPVTGAQVNVGGWQAGITAADGSLLVMFEKWPKTGQNFTAQKAGVGETGNVIVKELGDRVDLELYEEAVVTVRALEERNGSVRPVSDALVTVAGREVGRTSEDGVYVFRQKGKIGTTVAVGISAPGFIPESYSQKVKLIGAQNVQHFFYPVNARQPTVAIAGFSANTSGEDIGDIVKIVEPRFVEELFSTKAFKQVPAETARKLIKRSKLSYAKLKSSGWRGTALAEQVDVLVFASVARGEGDSFIVEASFYEPDGRLVMSQATVLSSTGSWRVGRAMSELVSNALANYPFSGMVTTVNEDHALINLGHNQFALDNDAVFVLKSAKRDIEGRVTGYKEGGIFVVRHVGENQTDIRPDSSVSPAKAGDKVVRLDTSESSKAEGNVKVTFVVNGGKEGEVLAGANLYLDQRWVGSTNQQGEASVTLRTNRKYDLIVYRHGYAQVSKAIEPKAANERFQFALKSFTSDLTLESNPSGAVVSLDDARIGNTPITKPVAVPLGFHTLRVDAGSNFRVWEEVVEFEGAEEHRTGDRSITLYKNYLKAAGDAEQAQQFDEAIKLYSAAPKAHPDYAEIRLRLGQLYLDEKHDADRAIAEFELVQAIPEVRELVLKQYAVVYTNLGKAYFTKGESLIKAHRNEAVEYFAKAIKALDRARENTRFFPDERHDEAVHDTYFYRALSYYSLFQITARESIRSNLELAWHEYLDFFPPKLRGNPEFDHLRESAVNLSQQLDGD